MKQIKTISIKCETSETLEIAEMKVFQGALKERTDVDYDKIKLSIIKFGFSFPFFLWKDKDGNNYLIDGTGRFETLCKMQKDGYIIPPLPVVYIQCKDKAEAKQKLLRLNSQYGKMSKESVLEFAEDIDLNFDEIALPDTVIDFSDAEEPQETEGDDDIPDIDEKEKPNSERGCLYELGNSILMCGDSTNAEDVARLMGGEKADMVFTDPPYNMSDHLTGFANEKTKKALSTIVDFDPNTIINTLFTVDTKNYFIFTSKELIPKYFEIFKEYRFNILVWCKDNPTPMTNNTFLPDVEYLLYFYQNGRIWNNGLDVSVYKKYYNSNKMEGRKEAGNVHPTIKPIKIIADKISICSNKDGVVVDLFGGSGSTLIACEKTNRKCRIMELDERYCDVIRRRYTKWAKENNKPLTSGCLED